MVNYLHGRARWVLVVWIFVLSAVGYLDRVNISIAGRSLLAEFHLTQLQLGWVFSAFVMGYALFQAPGGRLADRFGARWVLTLGVVWWGIFTSLTAMVPARGALVLLLGVRFLLGAGEAVVYPSSNRVVANWIPTQERGLANGLIFAGVGVGAGITPPLITYILIHHGWRWCFWASALIGFAACSVWYWLARDAPERHPWVTASELTHIRAGLSPSLERPPTRIPWRAILTSREVLGISFSYFCYGYIAYIFFTWFFIYLVDVRGLTLKAGLEVHDAALRGNGRLLAARRRDQRFSRPTLHQAPGTVRRGGCGHGLVGGFCPARGARAKC